MMFYNHFRIGTLIVACLPLAACNPFSSLKDDMVGRWESLRYLNTFIEFSAEGRVQNTAIAGGVNQYDGNFTVKDGGKVEFRYPGREPVTCEVTIVNSLLYIEPPKCVKGWEDSNEQSAGMKKL